MNNNNDTYAITQYVQFSKKVTRWGMILVSLFLFFCLASITFFNLSQTAANTIGKLYTSYITIMGIIVGAYQGNSSLEKWAKAKYLKEKRYSVKKTER